MSAVEREDKWSMVSGRAGGDAWPPPGTYWVTRDTLLDGSLDDGVDVWTAPPVRLAMAGYPRSYYWMSSSTPFDLSTRWGRYAATGMRACVGTVPETDRECVRFGE